MKLLKELKELKNHPAYKPGRFTDYQNGYRIDRYIIRAAFILMLLHLFFIAYSMDFDFSWKPYMNCHSMSQCENPFYIDPNCKEGIECPNGLYDLSMREKCQEDWCSQSYLPAGEYGSKKTKAFNWFFPISILLVFLALIINHLKYNRGFDFGKREA